MTLIEKYKDDENWFKFICNSYADCLCIDEIEGKIIHGEYSGYAIKDIDTGKKYFTEYGVRSIGIPNWYVIKNGEPHEILEPLSNKQIQHIYELIELKFMENGYTRAEIPEFLKFSFFRNGWENENDALNRERWIMSDSEYRELYKTTLNK